MELSRQKAFSFFGGVAISALACSSHAAGIAYVQIPEQGGVFCMGSSYEKAVSCAVNKCIAAGGNKTECIVQSWCENSRYSLEIFMQSKQGPHWHEFVCGLDSKAEAKAVESAICRSRQKQLDACMGARMIGPNGKEFESDNR